jgi:hypothetical protein
MAAQRALPPITSTYLAKTESAEGKFCATAGTDNRQVKKQSSLYKFFIV